MKRKTKQIILILSIISILCIPVSTIYAQDNQKQLQSIKEKSTVYNYVEPSQFPLKGENEFIYLYDENSQLHGISLVESNDYSETQGYLIFKYNCSDAYAKSDYIWLDVHKEVDEKIIYEQSMYWDVSNTGETYLAYQFDKDLYNKKYLYFGVGVIDSIDASYCEDYQYFKIKNPFYDDIKGHWAESTIRDFINKGYVGGYPDGTFKPNNSITRAEFVCIVNSYFGLTKSSGKVFDDTKTHWAKSAIDIAITNGVCNGKSATEFKPNDPITREEAAVMISNYKKIFDTNYDKLNMYADQTKVSNWAKAGVEGIIENGYMGGYSDNTFKPKNKITRAEAIATLSRVK